MTYKFNSGDTVIIEDIQAQGTVKLRAFSKADGTNYYRVEYFPTLVRQQAIEYFRESKLRGIK